MEVQKLISAHLLRRSVLSYLLYPASLLYSSFLLLRRRYYTYFFKAYQAPVFVISIGNIVSGGTGKTPFTIYLASSLAARGIKLAVSHRGYKSGSDAVPQLVSDRKLLLQLPHLAGDEAYLIAKSLPGIPVISGKHRKAAIQMLIKEFPDLDCIILDDSFQHLQVAHSLDILMVHEQNALGNGFVLPAGYLREPVSALKQADIIITNRYLESANATLRQQMSGLCPQVFTGKTSPGTIYNSDANPIYADHLKGKRLLLFSAIGNPAGFAALAVNMGLNIVGTVEYPDHYSYKDMKEWALLILKAGELSIDYFLTTEKDYVKFIKFPLHQHPLLVLPISFVLDKESDSLIPSIMQKIKTNNETYSKIYLAKPECS